MIYPSIHHPFRPLAIALFSFGLLDHAMAASTAYTMNVNTGIPDADPSGLASTILVNTPIQTIDIITVTLKIESDFAMWNGDYYAYLVHESGFVVLMNRPGRTATNLDGYSDSGFHITFDDLATGDVHWYQSILNPAGDLLTGDWQPDGRQIDPSDSLDTTPRGVGLSAFNGANPNGDWTLYVADVAAGGEGRLVSWTLNLQGQVPEPSTPLLTALGLFLAVLHRRRPEPLPSEDREQDTQTPDHVHTSNSTI